jgi:hypothetical protein
MADRKHACMWECYSATGVDTPIQRRVRYGAVMRASGRLDELAAVRDFADYRVYRCDFLSPRVIGLTMGLFSVRNASKPIFR